MDAHSLIDTISYYLRRGLPPGIDNRYLDSFLARNRRALVLGIVGAARQANYPLDEAPPDLWSVKERTQANLEAMRILASWGRQTPLTAEQRKSILRYSGWGGLSIEAVEGKFPTGIPAPDSRGLIHEYYTPTRVAGEVARALVPFMSELKGEVGILKGLEPSAGIGRFLRAIMTTSGVPEIDWTAVELSEVSGRLLQALYPEVNVQVMPFERWVRDNREAVHGKLHLVVSNPPYGPRGALAVEDPDKTFRVKQAYLYFLLRALDLLAKDGIGVFLVPGGFLTSARHEQYRERVLRTHHLMGAFRLPSQSEDTGDPIFPGANLVTDLLFFRSRGGELAEVPADDLFIQEGAYYHEFPEHILGEEYNAGEDSDDHTKRPRYRYAVVGEFTGLPVLEERPMSTGVFLEGGGRKVKHRGGVTREITEVKDLPEDLGSAVRLGLRADAYLAAVARGDTSQAKAAWEELRGDLDTWKINNGNPHKRAALVALAQKGIVGAERFLAAWKPSGDLIEALASEPKHEPVYQGEPTLVGQADWLFRQHGEVKVAKLTRAYAEAGGPQMSASDVLELLMQAGWCVDGEKWDQVVPAAVYYSGDLWPKVDRCRARSNDPYAAKQLAKLMEAIKPAVFEDLVDGLIPRESWMPVEVVQAWVNAYMVGGYVTPVELVREKGLLKPVGVEYDQWAKGEDPGAIGIPEKVVWFIGYANHHLALFRPPQPKTVIDGVPQKQPLDEVRLEIEAEWEKAFREWLKANPEMARIVEYAYNRALRGYLAPSYSSEPIYIARWNPRGPWPFDYQNAAARRVLANHCGLLAFDVGLGKTYTGIAILARARQEGWARRPVVLVPNSIVWKWRRDFERCLPSYNVAVVGSKLKIVASGPRKGRTVADVDTPSERAEKWSDFQAGRYDVVLLTYSALGRTKVDPDILYDYVDHVTAIQRRIVLGRAKERGSKKKKLSEREAATLEESVEGWIAERLEANGDWEYDPGIEWHSLGIDFLMVDESQNFKNLFMPEEREGGIPDAMGGTEESKRAWQLDFRCASVRAHTGGSGVVLLSATPAKNGPVEFYNAVHLINPAAWEQVGITDPEAFIDRYCAFEARTAQTPEGKLTVRQACVAFKNLHELRDVIFRYADFKTADDVGLKIPDASNQEHRVDLTEDQVEAIQDAWSEIRDLREEMKRMHGEAAAKMREALRLKIQGIAMRVDLIAIHSDLPGANKLTRVQLDAIDPHSGKIDAVVDEILATAVTSCPRRTIWGGKAGQRLALSDLKVGMRVVDGDDRHGKVVRVEKAQGAVVMSFDAGKQGEAKMPIFDELQKATKTEPGPDAEPPDWCLNCGHIVFVENIAVHYWLTKALVEAGIPRERIAILNAKDAKDPETRQQIAEAFNGVGEPGDEEYLPPKYDVVIANSVAYEGVDLQRRTCAIHHIDLPWDPSTLQQRNGRGVRQGNQFAGVRLHYYLGRPSGDGRRLTLIDKKRSWMSSLVKSQDRVTNNPAAAISVSIEDLLLDIVPAAERNRVLAEREEEARRLAEQRDQRVRVEANRMLSQVNARLRRAELDQTAAEAGRLQMEAEAIMEDLAKVDRAAWPWYQEAQRVRTSALWIPEEGMPLWSGLKVRRYGRVVELGAIGVDDEGKAVIGVREMNTSVFRGESSADVNVWAKFITRDDLDPADAPNPTVDEMRSDVERQIRWHGWRRLGWHLAPAGFVERWWGELSTTIMKHVADEYVTSPWVPFVVDGQLRLGHRDQIRWLRDKGQPIPPTESGWRQFLDLAPSSGQKFGDLDSTGRFWWSRRIPRNLLRKEAEAGVEVKESLKAARKATGRAAATYELFDPDYLQARVGMRLRAQPAWWKQKHTSAVREQLENRKGARRKNHVDGALEVGALTKRLQDAPANALVVRGQVNGAPRLYLVMAYTSGGWHHVMHSGDLAPVPRRVTKEQRASDVRVNLPEAAVLLDTSPPKRDRKAVKPQQAERMPSKDSLAAVSKWLEVECLHPSHNADYGCGNRKCWKYQAGSYKGFMTENPQARIDGRRLTKDEYGRLVITNYQDPPDQWRIGLSE